MLSSPEEMLYSSLILLLDRHLESNVTFPTSYNIMFA